MKLTSTGQIAIDQGAGSSSSAVGFFPRTVITNTTLTDGTGLVAPDSIEIASGIQLEIGSGSELEITGAANGSVLGYLQLGMDNCNLGLTQPIINLSTEGTVDWFSGTLSTTPPLTSGPSPHSKYSGGWILNSFRWDYGGTTCTPGTSSGNIGKTTTAGDDIANGVTTNDQTIARQVAPASIVNGIGYQFKVPVNMQRKVLRMIFGANACDLTVYASFSNGVMSKSQFYRNCFAAGSIPQWLFKAEYWGSPCDMTINVKSSGATANSSEVWFIAAWIALT
jgi:hypothetical protein